MYIVNLFFGGRELHTKSKLFDRLSPLFTFLYGEFLNPDCSRAEIKKLKHVPQEPEKSHIIIA